MCSSLKRQMESGNLSRLTHSNSNFFKLSRLPKLPGNSLTRGQCKAHSLNIFRWLKLSGKLSSLSALKFRN
ncbi:hypothetical protein R1flu_014813 [Riccia fluitans]|uniref:Uncharacterized protein n=1 Tax=Riccia fluitans TaxID=41844 RepID=A0ABD1YKY4_9MARC